MASPISPTTAFPSPAICPDSNLYSFRSPFLKRSHSLSYSYSYSVSHSLSSFKYPDSIHCCCRSTSSDSPSSSSDDGGWGIQKFIVGAARKLDDFINSRLKRLKDLPKGEVEVVGRKLEEEVDVEDWDWERWQQHFKEVEEQERLISILKSQLSHAIDKENYGDAARIKVAIAAAAAKDAVGNVMTYLKNAIEEEHYHDAVFVRDNAGTGLIGWWAGVSEDRNDPYGCIIRISAEHGRYVARSYSPRQLATSTNGVPLFEIFLTLNKKDEYRQQAVYLKRGVVSETSTSDSPMSADASSNMKNMNPNGDRADIFAPVVEDTEDDEDKDDPELADGFSGFQNVLQDMIPGVRVKVLKVTAPGKVDRDLISKVVEQIIEEEDEEDVEAELDSMDAQGGVVEEKDDSVMDADIGSMDREEQSELAVKVVVHGLVQKLSSTGSSRDLVRVPAKLKPNGRKSFSFFIQDQEDQQDFVRKTTGPKGKAKTQGQRSIDHVMSDLVKFINRGEKIPAKVLKDVGDLISLTLSQAQNRQPLSGSTSFNRIDVPPYPDPLNGLYIGSHGPYTSEVIQLKRKFGHWQEDGRTEGHSDLHFYEYVEAVKLTGDPYVPAGQVAFRAKIGKRYQLPHKGIIPEEFGVVARYKGQGRLAEPGFRNPRWVDGELVILDGKYIKAGPVIGFVYWAPEYQFLVFFNRLRIQD